jgi:signal transduction histidine kinase
MLHEFLALNQSELVELCRARVLNRSAPRPTAAELEDGVPLFLQQLIDLLRLKDDQASEEMIGTATRHGAELVAKGFTVSQVVHDYGDLCQAITSLADEHAAPIGADEFGALNRCLDEAIAAAVTEHARQREHDIEAGFVRDADARLAAVAHEMRNLLNTAMMSFEVIKLGTVPISGSTSAVHERALRGLRSLVDRELAEARLAVGPQLDLLPLVLLMDDVERAAGLEADALAIRFVTSPVDSSIHVLADRAILFGAVMNLLQNAFKFTRAHGGTEVAVHVRPAGDKIFIEVEDECGGLPWADAESLQWPAGRRGSDRTGLGLGLQITRRAVEANGGVLHARSLPGKGCVFGIELALAPQLAVIAPSAYGFREPNGT